MTNLLCRIMDLPRRSPMMIVTLLCRSGRKRKREKGDGVGAEEVRKRGTSEKMGKRAAVLYRILNKEPYRPAVKLDTEATRYSTSIYADDAYLTATAVVVCYIGEKYDEIPDKSPFNCDLCTHSDRTR